MKNIFRRNPLFSFMIILAFWQLLRGESRLALLLQSPITFTMLIVALILAITVHEFCHALAADRLGDPTPRLNGRLSLNPAKHFDPLGALMIIFTNFGWGKPVEFDPYNLRRPKRDSALIAASGPISNLLMAVLCALIVWALEHFLLPTLAIGSNWLFLVAHVILFFYTFGTLSISLAIFNLIPIRPLDGSHILRAVLPPGATVGFDNLMRHFGSFILLLLIFPFFGQVAPINYILTPIIDFLTNLLFPVI